MADAPDKTWAKAEITGVRSVESDQLGRPSSIHLTAVIFNGREIEWHLSWDETSFLAHFTEAYGNAPTRYSELVGKSVWVRKRYPRTDPIPDESDRWSMTGKWLLESPEHVQRRVSNWYRPTQVSIGILSRFVFLIGLFALGSLPWSGIAAGLSLTMPGATEATIIITTIAVSQGAMAVRLEL